MKKLISLLLVLLVCSAAALAEPVTLTDPLAGEAYWPEDADAATAMYVYRYHYPQVAGEGEVALMINEHYAYLLSDALGFALPMAEGLIENPDVQAYTHITSEITCHSDDYLCVKITTENFMGAAISNVVSAHTFALTGGKAGCVVNLPYLLGLLDADETDEWLLTRQTDKADSCVRGLIWEIIRQQQAEGAVAYYEGVTYEMLEGCFYPEEDFYLDAEGNLVFFIQESLMAPSTEGVLYFPFTLEELLDEI